MAGSGLDFVEELERLFRAVERGDITGEQGLEIVAIRWGNVRFRIPRPVGLERDAREIPSFRAYLDLVRKNLVG